MQITYLYKSIRNNSKGKVIYFRSDWRHDRAHLKQMYEAFKNKKISNIEFVHVSKESATHIFPVYQDNLDISRPYLFGHCTPRQTLSDFANIFQADSCTFTDKDIVQYYDGNKLQVITKAQANRIFILAYQAQRHSQVA